MLHKLAFRSTGMQVTLSELEESQFSNELASIPLDRPVFITGLPRAGTTILLNLLAGSGCFASHTYRDMPFILCPMLWQRFSKYFQTDETERERAHGDGLLVGSDSPEAFEEIIWKHFWSGHYGDDHIEPWSQCDDIEFMEFFRQHMRKIVALRRVNSELQPRYVSKNNLNIARLACLHDVAGSAKIVVLFREPLQHASSLLKQHKKFLERHANDAFAKDYMKGIGHFDFGQNLRPINFDGWLDDNRRSDALSLEFWVEYWLCAYRNIVNNLGPAVHLLSFRRLTEEPKRELEVLASFLEMDRPELLLDQLQQVKPPGKHGPTAESIDEGLLTEARTLYSRLEEVAPV